jgi:ABC-type dipeptide/oligopeptide/nickel transport system permease component
MALFLARRLVFVIPVLLGVSLLAFVVTHLLPGDPARIYAGIQANEATVEGIRARFGLDKPLPIQYVTYVAGLLRGDLGTSLRTQNGVTADLIARVPATVELVTAAMLFALFVGVPLGMFAAIRHGGGVDRTSRTVASVGVALPDFWLGLILIFVFYVTLHWLPAPVGRLGILDPRPNGPTGIYTLDSLLHGDLGMFANASSHLIMPALALGIPIAGALFRLTRNSTLDVLNSEYVLFARASGLAGSALYRKYVLRNVIPSTVTLTAVIFGFLIGGSVLVERVFAWPGVGLYMSNSLDFNDYAAIQGFVMLSAIVYLLVFLATDVIQAWLDPRVRVA